MDTQKTPISDSRRWYDKKRFVLLLLFFIFPVGLYFLWKGNAFSKEGKIGLSIGCSLFFFMYLAGSLVETKNQNNQTVDNNLPDRVDMSAEEGTVQFNNQGEEVGRTEEEEGVKINMTKISQEFFRGEKAVFEFRLSDRATKKQLISIANLIKEDHPGYKRYFIGYYLPNQKVGKGSWATTHFNPDLEVNILGLTYSDYNKLMNVPVNFKGKKIGKWFIDMGVLGHIGIISKLDNGKYIVTEIHKDGSSGEKELVKKGTKYIYENDFGEYYQIEKNGKLSHYSENGKFAEYEVVEEKNNNSSSNQGEITGESFSKLLVNNPKARWASDNISMNDKWDMNLFKKHLGNYESVELTKWQPDIMKAYYFPEAEMTLFHNIHNDNVAIIRGGSVTE